MNAQCINTYCLHKSQRADRDACEICGCSLLIKGRFRATSRLGQLNNVFSSPRTQTFDAIDLIAGQEVILRVVHSDQEKLVRPLKNAVIALRHIHDVSLQPGVMQLIEEVDFGYFTWRIRPDEPDAHCMVAKKVLGVTLQERIDTCGAVDETLARQWLRQLLEAVKEIHRANFLHRDVKPENVIVTSSQQLVLIDFDTICSMDWPLSRTNLVPGAGTAAYMAPEQSKGEPRPASDLYSIGRVMIELLTGKLISDVARIPNSDKVDWHKESPKTSKQFTVLVDKLSNENTIYRPADTDEALSFLAEVESEIARRRKWRWIDNSFVKTASILLVLSACIGVGASFSRVQLKASEAQAEEGSQLISEADRLLAEGNQLILTGATSEGLALIEDALALEPDSVEILSSLAIAQNFLGDANAATASYERALQLDPDNPYVLYNIANVYEESDLETAISYYIAASGVDSLIRSDALNNLARAYLLTDRLQLAEEVLSNPVLTPEDIEDPRTRTVVFKNLGWLNYLRGNFETAKKQLARSIEAYPYQADAYCLLALMQAEAGEENFNDRMTCLYAASTDKPEVQSWREQLTGPSLNTSP